MSNILFSVNKNFINDMKNVLDGYKKIHFTQLDFGV